MPISNGTMEKTEKSETDYFKPLFSAGKPVDNVPKPGREQQSAPKGYTFAECASGGNAADPKGSATKVSRRNLLQIPRAARAGPAGEW